MVWRLLSNVYFLVAIALSAAGLYVYFVRQEGPYSFIGTPDRELPCLAIAEIELELSDCVAGEKRAVVFQLDNRSGKPMRVLGLTEC